ncbi:MAG: insulinase family protein [Gemmatimonadetes bacterium]|nr:insulinase family protein [Gemmatimonadota bacterium]
MRLRGSSIALTTETRKLENGLTVVLAPDRATPIVAVNLWYGVGSRNENVGRTGFAHLFEHMMFQGSEHVPKGHHFQLVEQAGGTVNASTWFDRTNYFETLPAHHLDLALWLESDRMGWLLPAMDQEKLDNQRDVVRNERQQRYDNQPYGDWDERMHALVFPHDHPYHHSVIGSMQDLARASLSDVEEFFRTYYRPNNAVLTLAGDFDPDSAFARVERYFGELPRGREPPPVPGKPELEPWIGRVSPARVTGQVPLPRVYLGARIPSFADPSYYAADMASSVLAAGRASRLYRRLVREQRIARDVVAFSLPLVTGRSLLACWITGFPGGDPDELEGALVRELEGLVDVRSEEIERVLALAETAHLRGLEHLSTRADHLSMQQMLFGDASRVNTEVDRLRAVTAEDVRAFAEAVLVPENRAVLTYVPGEVT